MAKTRSLSIVVSIISFDLWIEYIFLAVFRHAQWIIDDLNYFLNLGLYL